jgi:hypothetical protein
MKENEGRTNKNVGMPVNDERQSDGGSRANRLLIAKS